MERRVMTDELNDWDGAQRGRRWTTWLWRILGVAGAVLALAITGFVAWGLTPLGPAPEATAAMHSDAHVRFSDMSEGLTFMPSGTTPTTGIILYPGGHVDYRSYATLARDLASAGYLVVVTPMPLSLAVFAPNRADEVIVAYPEVKTWALAGHSLGGAMACAYVDSHPGTIDGLVLLAAYPAGSDDLRADKLQVVSLVGTKDTVINRDNLEAGKALLPQTTTYTTIEGGNHAQFGSYGEQPGDGVATITPLRQRAETVAAVKKLLAP
jgi:dienelactone hydrolase